MRARAVESLHRRTMRRIVYRGGALEPIPDHERGDIYAVDLEKLRIVIGEALDVAYRMGYRVGTSR